MRPWSPDETPGATAKSGLHGAKPPPHPQQPSISSSLQQQQQQQPVDRQAAAQPEQDDGKGAGTSNRTSNLLSYTDQRERAPARSSRLSNKKPSRRQHSRPSRSSRDSARINSIIGREFTLGVGDHESGGPSTDGHSTAGSSNITAKIWVEDNPPPRDIHDGGRQKRRAMGRSGGSRLASREMPFEDQKFEAVLFSRETLSSSQAGRNQQHPPLTGSPLPVGSASPIAAQNVVAAKRARTNITNNLFKDKVEWLSSNSSKMPRYADKRGRRSNKKNKNEKSGAFSSKRRQP
jgi:hypothetical protein